MTRNTTIRLEDRADAISDEISLIYDVLAQQRYRPLEALEAKERIERLSREYNRIVNRLERHDQVARAMDQFRKAIPSFPLKVTISRK